MIDYDDIPTILGYIGSGLLIISFIAQLLIIYWTKNVESISHVFITLQFIVNVTYFIYDISINSIPLMIGNGTIAILLIFMYAQKIYYSCFYDGYNFTCGRKYIPDSKIFDDI